jgi:hypothetical protein
MKITIPNKVRWQKPIHEDPLSIYSKEKRRRIRQIVNDPDSGINTRFTPLDEAGVAWFEPLYQETIGQKQNAVLHNIADTTIHSGNGAEYWLLELTERGETIGGTIFSIREDRLNIAYRVYPQTWTSDQSGANPSLFTDYIISLRAQELGKSFLSHGKDRNPYGVNSSIGLAIFKLSVGCRPLVPAEREFHELDTDTITEDTLAFLQPENANEPEAIQQAILFTTEESLNSYVQVTKYPDLVSVETRILP